jgi:hypothetical protein
VKQGVGNCLLLVGQIRQAIRVADDATGAAVGLIAHLALSLDELIELSPVDRDRERRLVVVDGRILPAGGEIDRLLTSWFERRGSISRSVLAYRLCTLGVALGFELNADILRSTAVAHMVAAGADRAVVEHALGHRLASDAGRIVRQIGGRTYLPRSAAELRLEELLVGS